MGFRLAVLQHSYNDPEMKVKTVLDHNRPVNDAKRDNFEITYFPIDLATAAVVAMGDSSFANVGKRKTESQAGWVLMLVDSKGGEFFKS